MARSSSEEKLTPKQAEVLVALRAGAHPTEIAKELGISTNGVYQHMKRIREAKISFPEPKRNSPGRPKSAGTKKRGRPPKQRAERIGVIGNGGGGHEADGQAEWDGEQPARPTVSIEDEIAHEIKSGEERLMVIEASLNSLGKEKEELIARKEKLAKAGEALALA